MALRRRPAARTLAATSLLVALAGCVAPTIESTAVFADVWDGRLVLVLNLFRIIEQDERFAIYWSDIGSLDRWTLAGTYGGRARAAAAREGLVWVFFEGRGGGRPFARTYRFPGGARDARGTPASPVGPAPPEGAAAVQELPFAWTPRSACRGAGGALWVAGVEEGRVVAARLLPGEGRAWDSFPPGPALEVAALGDAGSSSRQGARARGRGISSERRAAPARVRISAGEELFVFWSVTPAEAASAGAVRGARLAPEEGVWQEVPAYPLPHRDFCAAPSARGAPGIALTRYLGDWDGRRALRPHRVELRPDGAAWGPPEDVSAATQRFLFGYAPRAAWSPWEGGELLVRTNTQRVEILERSGGKWRGLVPAGSVALYLTEIQVILLGAGAFLLVVVGGAAFAVRLRRLGSHCRAPRPARPAGLPRLAPISRRAIAAMLDVLLVTGAALALVPLPAAPANPLVPDPRPLLLHLGALVALVVYGAATEAAFGATPGKLALGLRVELADGGRPGVARAILRNLVRPIDIVPPYLGAVGLSLMMVTGLRQRLGDLAAGTVVVAAPTAAAGDRDERR